MERIRLGMVGGGNDAFIGGVHRIASRIDDHYELVAGALSSTPEKSQASGEALGLPRIYDDYKSMAIRELGPMSSSMTPWLSTVMFAGMKTVA